MLSRSQVKYIRSLAQQKFRDKHRVFLAEGVKVAGEWLNSAFKIQHIIVIADWAEGNKTLISRHPEAIVHVVGDAELHAMSGLTTPNKVILVIHYPVENEWNIGEQWYLALDDIQDPGNMGAIIRIADWFGIGSILCSYGSTHVYNPKVVQAAMGSHVRVFTHVCDLKKVLSTAGLPIFAATISGESVYNTSRQDKGVIVIGNESKGISSEILSMAHHQITIPRIGGAESLNAAVATGILCALLLPC